MAIAAGKLPYRKRAASGSGSTRDVSFRLPNPGDVFMLVAFAWAAVCFLLVTGGERIARRAAMLSGSAYVRDLMLTEQSAIGILMLVGILGLAISFYLFNRFPNMTLGLFLFSMSFASAQWIPLHDFSFAFKYLLIGYFGAYGFLFFLRNGWKLTELRGYRLVLIYVGWIGLTAVINGFRIGDLWYTVTEFVLMIGLGIGVFGLVQDTDRLRQINYVIGYTAVVATFFHFLSSVTMPQFTAEGRFVSYFSRATGFANSYAVFVVPLFWLTMYEKRLFRQRLFTVLAFAGFGLILWSGSRSATVASFVGIAAVWWVIRSRILMYVLVLGIIGVLVQLILAESEEFARISDRLASTENTRLEVWTLYWEVWLTNPLLGYGYDGLARAVFGATLADTLGNYVRLTVPAVHNHYLGFMVRFGLIGLIFSLALFYFPLRCAWQVVMSRDIDQEQKSQYILPVAITIVIMLEGLFEDTMGSTGRGTLHGIAMGMTVPLVYVLGRRLLAESAENANEANPKPGKPAANT